jgi:hypothetical protein
MNKFIYNLLFLGATFSANAQQSNLSGNISCSNDDIKIVVISENSTNQIQYDDEFKAPFVAERSNDSLIFCSENPFVNAGDEFQLNFTANQGVWGYQFTLQHTGLQVLDIIPLSSGLSSDNFAVFQDRFTHSWHNTSSNINVQPDPKQFGIKFRANQSGQVASMLSLVNEPTSSTAFAFTQGSLESVEIPVALCAGLTSTNSLEELGVQVGQNIPNPWQTETLIPVTLNQLEQLNLRIFDVAGRELLNQTATYPAGNHQVVIQNANLGAPAGAMLWYQISTSKGTITKKMTRF